MRSRALNQVVADVLGSVSARSLPVCDLQEHPASNLIISLWLLIIAPRMRQTARGADRKTVIWADYLEPKLTPAAQSSMSSMSLGCLPHGNDGALWPVDVWSSRDLLVLVNQMYDGKPPNCEV